MKTQKETFAMTTNELNRAHVVQSVKEKKLTISEGAIRLGLSARQVKRLLKRFSQEGAPGLIARWHGSGSGYTESFKSNVMSIVSEQYKDFRPTLAAEKLRERNDIKVNRETLRQWMIEKGLWSGKKRKKIVTHQSRARRSRLGELIQIDGSPHDWFEGRSAKCCLLVFIDDATSRIMHLRFESAETTMGYFRCVKEYVVQYGCPVAFYSDKYGVFTVNKSADKVSGLHGTTQFQRAMRELDIEIILANSPQAKGRVERANQTLQDRLIKDMRLSGIDNIEQANGYLPEFIKRHNAKFAIDPFESTDSHRALNVSVIRLDMILSNQETRELSKNLEFSYKSTLYQVQRPGTGYTFRAAKVTVCEHADGRITVWKDKELLKYTTISKSLYKLKIADRKEVNAIVDKAMLAIDIDSRSAPTQGVAVA